MSLAKRLNLGAAMAVGLLGLTALQAQAQRAPQTKEGASIVIDGMVREIFRSPRQSQTDYLVQIEVSRSEYGRSPADPRRVQAPAPGDQIYVHVSQANDNRSRPGGGGARPSRTSGPRSVPISTRGRRGAGKGPIPSGTTSSTPRSRAAAPTIPSLPPTARSSPRPGPRRQVLPRPTPSSRNSA